MTWNGNASAQHPRPDPDERMVAIGDVGAIAVVDKGLGRLLPGVAARLNGLPPVAKDPRRPSGFRDKRGGQEAKTLRGGKPPRDTAREPPQRRPHRAGRQSGIKHEHAHAGLGE
jgi:hypothetical protein